MIEKNGNTLYEMIKGYKNVWDDPKRFRALLMDYYPSDKLRRNLIFACVEEHIPHQMVKMENYTSQDIHKFTKTLTESYGCEYEYAKEIVLQWFNALSIEKDISNDNEDSLDLTEERHTNIFEKWRVKIPDYSFDELSFEESDRTEKDVNKKESNISFHSNRAKYIPIEEFGVLSIREYNFLKKGGIKTLGDLIKKVGDDDGELMGTRTRLFRSSDNIYRDVLEDIKASDYFAKEESDCEEEDDHHGKEKCDKLRRIRKKIAEINSIPFEPIECHHKGACLGTCPVCDEEIKYLEEEIRRKKENGEEIILTGIASDDVVESGWNELLDS